MQAVAAEYLQRTVVATPTYSSLSCTETYIADQRKLDA